MSWSVMIVCTEADSLAIDSILAFPQFQYSRADDAMTSSRPDGKPVMSKWPKYCKISLKLHFFVRQLFELFLLMTLTSTFPFFCFFSTYKLIFKRHYMWHALSPNFPVRHWIRSHVYTEQDVNNIVLPATRGHPCAMYLGLGLLLHVLAFLDCVGVWQTQCSQRHAWYLTVTSNWSIKLEGGKRLADII